MSLQPASSPQALMSERWVHVFRSMIDGGDAQRMGRTAFFVYVVLKAYTDMRTGEARISIEALAEALGRPVRLEAFKKALWRARKAARLQPPSEPAQSVPEPVLINPEPVAETKGRPVVQAARSNRSVLPTRQSLTRPMGFDMQALQTKAADDLV